MEIATLTAITTYLNSISITCNDCIITLSVDPHGQVTAFEDATQFDVANIGVEAFPMQRDSTGGYRYIILTISTPNNDDMKFKIKVPEFVWKQCTKTLKNIQSALHPPHEETTDGEAKAPDNTNSGGAAQLRL